jgi:hypothetical protein
VSPRSRLGAVTSFEVRTTRRARFASPPGHRSKRDPRDTLGHAPGHRNSAPHVRGHVMISLHCLAPARPSSRAAAYLFSMSVAEAIIGPRVPERFISAVRAVEGLAASDRYVGAFIFGSVARATATEASDLDVRMRVSDDNPCPATNHTRINDVKLCQPTGVRSCRRSVRPVHALPRERQGRARPR